MSSNQNWVFTVPTGETKDYLYLGNYKAIRCSGYYNGNKVSWQVIKVMWIVGEFPPHSNLECDFARKVIETLDIQFENRNNPYGYSVTSRFSSSTGYSYVELKDYGHMTKHEAKKLLKTLHEQDDHQTTSYECRGLDINNAIKHVTQAISLNEIHKPTP